MPRLAAVALLALPAWSALAWQLHRLGGRRLAVAAGLGLALVLATWGGSRVGTGNPISRTARWDPWLAGTMILALLAIPGLAATAGIHVAVTRHTGVMAAIGAGVLAGLLAIPVAFVAALAIEVVWPH